MTGSYPVVLGSTPNLATIRRKYMSEETKVEETKQEPKPKSKVEPAKVEETKQTQTQTISIDLQKIIDLDEKKSALFMSEVNGILSLKNPYKTKATLLVEAIKRYAA